MKNPSLVQQCHLTVTCVNCSGASSLRRNCNILQCLFYHGDLFTRVKCCFCVFCLSQWVVTWSLRHQAVAPPQGKRAGRRPGRSLLKPNRDDWIRCSRRNVIRTTTTDIRTENKHTLHKVILYNPCKISWDCSWWYVPGPGRLSCPGAFVCGALWGCVAAPGTRGFGMKLVLLCSSWAWVSASGPTRSTAG